MPLAPISRRTILTLLAGAAIGVSATTLLAARTTADPQPHMKMALEALRSAQGHLAQAVADKGGHRVKAEEHVKMAIDEVEAGIKFANQH